MVGVSGGGRCEINSHYTRCSAGQHVRQPQGERFKGRDDFRSDGMLNNWPMMTAAVVAIFAVLVKALKMLGTVLEFREKHFIEKRYKRLRELRSHMSKGNLATYLDGAVELEAFRIASGIKASPRKADAISKIASLGFWHSNEIRQLSTFLVVDPIHAYRK